MTEFASLKPQDVREHWEHEEHDFTPWLAKEIEAEEASNLENSLGIDLEVIEREKQVGKYNVDIYAQVLDDNRKVIIENQLQDSDHDHLGKAIAYAAGVDADIIVWIAPQFNDEHSDAIQWLNTNSREGIDLFAIRLEVWRIADSPPAVRLNPVEKPSEWKEKARRSRGELSNRDKRREEFWTEFRDRIADASTPLRPRKPEPSARYSNPIGVSGYYIDYYVEEDNDELGLDLIITDNEAAYWELKNQIDDIEAELGTEINVGELRQTRTGNMRSDLEINREADITDQSKWDAYFDWMIEQGTSFHEVFPKRLRQIEQS